MRRIWIWTLTAVACCAAFCAQAALAQELHGSGMVYQSENAIFYVADGVRRMDLDGSNDVQIAEAIVTHIAGCGDSLFYIGVHKGQGFSTLYHYSISVGEARALCSYDETYVVAGASEDFAYVGWLHRVDLEGNIETMAEWEDLDEDDDRFDDGFWDWGMQDIQLDGKRFWLEKDSTGLEETWDSEQDEDDQESTCVTAIRLCAEANGKQEKVWAFDVSPKDTVYYKSEVKLFEYGGTLFVQFPLERDKRFAAYNIIYAIDPETYEATKVVDAHCSDYGGMGYYVNFVPVGDWGFVYLSGDGDQNTIHYATKFKLADLIPCALNAQSVPKQDALHGQELVYSAEDAIYYVADGLHRMDTDGGNDTMIAGSGVRYIAPWGDWLYYVNNGTLYRYSLLRSESQALWTGDGDCTLWAVGEDCAFVGQYFLRFGAGQTEATFFGEATSMQHALQGIVSEPFRQWGTQAVPLGDTLFSLQIDEPDPGWGVEGVAVYANKHGAHQKIWEFTREGDDRTNPHAPNAVLRDPDSIKLFAYDGTLFVQFPLSEWPAADRHQIYAIDPETYQATKVMDATCWEDGRYGCDIEFHIAGGWGFVYLNDYEAGSTRSLIKKLKLSDALKLG